MNNIREKLDPNAGSYTAEEISDDLDIPIEIIDRMKKVGILIPDRLEGVDWYSMKDIRFIDKYWNATKSKLLKK